MWHIGFSVPRKKTRKIFLLPSRFTAHGPTKQTRTRHRWSTMKLFRIQHKDQQKGMWRGLVDGKPIVEHLSDKKLANMPMPEHPRYSKDGKVWKSAVNSKEPMFAWFTKRDIEEMVALGMMIISFECEDCYMVELQEVLFNEADMRDLQDITVEFLSMEA